MDFLWYRRSDSERYWLFHMTYFWILVSFHLHPSPQKRLLYYTSVQNLSMYTMQLTYLYSVRKYVLSCVQLFAAPWMVAHQAPLSMGFPRQEYWSGLLFPPPGDLPDPGIKGASLSCIAGRFFTDRAASGFQFFFTYEQMQTLWDKLNISVWDFLFVSVYFFFLRLL